jgi:hypothetical protein
LHRGKVSAGQTAGCASSASWHPAAGINRLMQTTQHSTDPAAPSNSTMQPHLPQPSHQPAQPNQHNQPLQTPSSTAQLSLSHHPPIVQHSPAIAQPALNCNPPHTWRPRFTPYSQQPPPIPTQAARPSNSQNSTTRQDYQQPPPIPTQQQKRNNTTEQQQQQQQPKQQPSQPDISQEAQQHKPLQQKNFKHHIPRQ